jgi:hypothetical protein
MNSAALHHPFVYPRFTSRFFWNFRDARELVGAKYSAIPLGLMTVAAMLPPSREARLKGPNVSKLDPDLSLFPRNKVYSQEATLPRGSLLPLEVSPSIGRTSKGNSPWR